MRSPLHYAAKDARLLAVSYLMGIASNPNFKDRYGNTALDLALQGGTLYHKCVLSEFILERHVNVFFWSSDIFIFWQILCSSVERVGRKHGKFRPN